MTPWVDLNSHQYPKHGLPAGLGLIIIIISLFCIAPNPYVVQNPVQSASQIKPMTLNR